MDEILERIKGYVRLRNPDLNDDDFLELMIEDVVDSALIYMNRDNLVEQYEQDLIDYPVEDSINDDFWSCYDYPFPKRLEKPLAKTVVSVYKNAIATNAADNGAIRSIKDNGQEVTYSDLVSDYLNNADEKQVFSGILVLLDNYRLGDVI